MTLKILLVDDNISMVSFLGKYLNKKGYQNEGVYAVPDALESISKKKFDVVIADVCFNQFSGLVLLKSIKSRGDMTPVIMMSGYAKSEQVLECLRIGAYDFLFKPFRLEVLAEILKGIENRNERFAKLGVIE